MSTTGRGFGGDDDAPDVAGETDINVMTGSSADLSTEAGKLLMEEIEHGGQQSDALLLDDSSDRLYLLEQNQWKRERELKEKAADDAALASFRLAAQSNSKEENVVADSLVNAAVAVKKKAKTTSIGFTAAVVPRVSKKKSKNKVKAKNVTVKIASNQTLCAYGDSDSSSAED